jgi:hypothetical protein
MKKIIIAIMAITICACQSKEKVNTDIIKQEKVKINDETIIEKTKGLLVNEKNIFKDLILKKGEVLKQKFLFVNKGSEQVEILGYTTSCNCTSITVAKNILQPNDSTIVEIVMESKEKLIGKDKITATLTTNGQRKYYFISASFEIK